MLHDAVVESAAGDTARQLAELHGAGGPPGPGAADVARVTPLLDECLAASSAAEAAERASRLLGGPPLGPAGAGTQQGYLEPPGFEPPPYSQTIPLSFDPEPPQDVRKLSEQFSAMNDENENLGAARRDERGLYFNACSTLDKYRRRRRRREEEADRRIDPSLDATLDPEADDDDDGL